MAGLAAGPSALALENKRLREALVFAERGWRDALSFVSSQQQASAESKPEDVLEIRSLQHEINVLQRQVLKRAQMADEFQRALTFSADELEQVTNQLMVYLHAEVPIGKTTYAPPIWTVDFPSDSDVSSNSQLTRLGRMLRKLQAVSDWVKENNLEKFPHYEKVLAEAFPPAQKEAATAEEATIGEVAKKKKTGKAVKKKQDGAEETASVSVKSVKGKAASKTTKRA